MTSSPDPISELADPSRQSRRIWAVVSVVGVLLLAFLVVLGSRFGSDPSLVKSPLIGKPVPDLTLPLLEGDGEVSLRQKRGTILVINFWASWCTACRDEHPDLMATAAAYADRGVEFLGIVYQDDPQAAIAFLDELGRGYPSVLDPGSLAAIEFGVFGVPETFFIDADGIIAGKITGQSNAFILASTLDTLLAGGRPGSQTVGTVQSSPDS